MGLILTEKSLRKRRSLSVKSKLRNFPNEVFSGSKRKNSSLNLARKRKKSRLCPVAHLFLRFQDLPS